MLFPFAALVAPALLAASASARFIIYADEWHPTRPTNPADRAGIDHVVLAFAMANATAAFQPKVPISTIRSEFPNAKVMIAVGGWGDDIGFFEASKSGPTIDKFAADIATMLQNTGADGVDIDWEYPGGNGADYKQVPNSQKTYQIDAFPKTLAAIRKAIGGKLLSIAVPGKKVDMIGFTKATGPKIWPSVDYINVMSYDLMNRRDTATKHHTSVKGSEDTIKNYLAIGAPASKMNLGFAYYAKYFTTAADCSSKPLGCPIELAEDPVTGKDTLKSGAWTFEPAHMKPVDASALTVSYDGTCGPDKGTKCGTGCCSQYGNCGTTPEHCSGACQHAFGTGCTDADVAGSWQNALKNGVTDEDAGGQYYYDKANGLFWTWDTPALISRKFDRIVRKYKLGGVMAWSLGEDSFDWSHIHAMANELKKGGNRHDDNTDQRSRFSSHPMIPVPPPDSPEPSSESPPESAPEPAPEPAPPSAPEPSPASESASDVPPPPEPLPEDPPAPTTEDPSPSAPSPWQEVYVDGTAAGPEADYSPEPGAPDTYTIPDLPEPIYHYGPLEYHPGPASPDVIHDPQQETASTPQESQPLVALSPLLESSEPASAPEQASTPESEDAAAPEPEPESEPEPAVDDASVATPAPKVEDSPAPAPVAAPEPSSSSATTDDLPFSPEYLDAVKKFGAKGAKIRQAGADMRMSGRACKLKRRNRMERV